MIAHISQSVPLSTSTLYEACAISNLSTCYTKVRSLFQAFLTSMISRASRRVPYKTLNYKHASGDGRSKDYPIYLTISTKLSESGTSSDHFNHVFIGIHD